MAENFYETIFLKRNSYQEDEFKKIVNKNTEKYKSLEKGLEGEKEIEYHLTKSNIGMYVIRDVNIEYDGMTAQIDYIVITSKHCYFIECKNYSGNVKVDDSGNFTVTKKYGRRFHSQGIYSPIRQVEAQLDVFLKICLNNQDKTKELLNGIRFKDYFKTLVVFTNSESILRINKAPEDIKDRVLKVDNLIRILERDQKDTTNGKLTKEQMEKVGKFFLEINKERKVKDTKQIVTNNDTRKMSPINILLCIYLLVVGFGISYYSYIYYPTHNKHNNKVDDSTQGVFTNNQLESINDLKAAYDSSINNGFELIHTNTCKQVSSIFDGSVNCNRLPMYVNFIDDTNLTIKKDFTCYKLKYDKKTKKIETISKEYIAYDTEHKCDGTPIGFFDWDPENEYFKQIGGYEKIREMAIYAYNNNSFVTNYYDGSHMLERGGIPNNYTIYKMKVDMFFSGLTDRGYSIKSDTTRDKTNEMCEALYYIGK
ncbi:MAG: nuclease-related domain-containing protein [Bacilli bacterium]|nr:nuclease-related domain-containing protein [Bacilli bacterium]